MMIRLKSLLTEDEGLGLPFPKQNDIYKISTDKGVFKFKLDSQRGQPGVDADGRKIESAWNITVVQSEIPSIEKNKTGQCQIFVEKKGTVLYFNIYNLSDTNYDGDTETNITKVN